VAEVQGDADVALAGVGGAEERLGHVATRRCARGSLGLYSMLT
jgi:hypothetical protein